ncbi:MAG: acyl-CoA dehydrogenase family protein [Kiritimatiellia bacterium]
MANFYTDNEDIQFLFRHMDLDRLSKLTEENYRFAGEFDFAPSDAAEARDNYNRILTTIGEIVGERVALSAADTDTVGNQLNADGSVTYSPGISEALKLLSQADVMGFTLPYRYGGLNCPQLLYTMSNDIVSRADAALMNLYGLQGIAETINNFASEEIKREYLPRMASGEFTGAMVLTEPDAGSDLQAVKTRAYQDASGNWFIRGVKRFITNGCGEVLLVLARTEPEIADGRGLSCLLVERNPRVRVRRLEHKLGINGSPTCELVFDDCPAKLIGERQRGLITYVMSLMNGARIGIAAQSLGIGEASCRVARDYARSRKQFNSAIDKFPSVRDLIVDMSLDLQAARAITYYAAFSVDLEMSTTNRLDSGKADAEETKRLRTDARKYKGHNKLLTPMAKYYASEMSMRTSNGAMAVLGGSGYMKDYAVERHLRDARITTIYEGTSQLQVVAMTAGVVGGTIGEVINEVLGNRAWSPEIEPVVAKIREGMGLLNEAVAFVKTQPGNAYRDLHARKLADIACYLLAGSLFCDHATANPKKVAVAIRWMNERLPQIRMLKEQACSGEASSLTDFETLACQLPVAD